MIGLSQKIVRQMRQDVFEKILSLPVGALDRVQAGDLINRISYDIDTVNASLSNDILQAATGIITVAGALVGMILTSPALLGVFAVTIPISVVITVRRSKAGAPALPQAFAETRGTERFFRRDAVGAEDHPRLRQGGGDPVQIPRQKYGRGGRLYAADYYGSLIGPSGQLRQQPRHGAHQHGRRVFLPVRADLRRGYIRFPALCEKVFRPVNEYANIMGEIQSALAAAERIFRLLDAESEAPDREGAAELTDVRGSVRFENVKFSYDGKEDVIHGLSFSAEPGQTVAVVGPTGAAKPRS